MKDGLCPAAKAVKRDPSLLYNDAATLQRKWDVLTLSTERGGVGIAFSTEQACEAVRKFPSLSQMARVCRTRWHANASFALLTYCCVTTTSGPRGRGPPLLRALAPCPHGPLLLLN